ncbi:MAG: hypothetical protein WD275_08865 [Rhodothermales bacterium]
MTRRTSILEPGEPGANDRWRALWEKSPQRSPFSSLEFLTTIAALAGLRLAFHLVSSDTVDVAGSALTWRRRGPYREVVVPPFAPYSAVLLDASPAGEADHDRSSDLDMLLESIEHRFQMARLHLHVSLHDVRRPAWRGWNVHPLYTYVTDAPISGMETTDGWSSGPARTFRNSEADYELIDDGSAAVASVNLCIDGYARKERKLTLPPQRLLPFVQHLREAGLATSFAVRHRASFEIEGAVTVLADRQEGFYWVAGSRPGPAMTVLIGKMLPLLAERGLTRFDFMGANTPSVAEFKRKFGTRLETYYGMTYLGRRTLKLASTLRRMIS